MVDKKNLLELGILAASAFFVLKAISSNISQGFTIPKIPQLGKAIDFTKPLPFKTVEQQKSEFIPKFENQSRVGRFRDNSPSLDNFLKIVGRQGFTDIEKKPVVRKGKNTGSVFVIASRMLQTNVFKPQLTSL